jgi:hypothetical protein
MTTQATIVDQQQAYPPTPVVIDRPTQDTFEFVTASAEVHRRYRQDVQDQVERATTRLVAQLNRQRRRVGAAALRQAAYRQVLLEHRRMADEELRGMQPAGQLVGDAGRQEDAELYRRREQALAVLLDEQADAYAYLVPQVLADRESACRQQAVLVDEQDQLNRQLRRLRWVRGLLGLRRVRQLHAELVELDRQLTQVQGEIAHQQALLDVIQAADTNRDAWLTRHQHTLHRGAAAVLVLTRRLLALANPPGSTRPVGEVDLDHPIGHDPLAPPPASNGGTASVPAGEHAHVALSTAQLVAASPAQPDEPHR